MNNKIISLMEKYNIKFNENPLEIEYLTPYKTKDAKKIFKKTIDNLSNLFEYPQTKCILGLLLQNSDSNSNINFIKDSILIQNKLNFKSPKKKWKIPYDILVVTEDESSYSKLNRLKIPCELLLNENQIEYYKSYDIIRVYKCDKFSNYLEELPQAEFTKENPFPELNLILLSEWIDNIIEVNNYYKIEDFESFIELKNIFDIKKDNIINFEEKITILNNNIPKLLDNLTFTGKELINIMNKTLPKELKEIIREELKKENIPFDLVKDSFPLEIDEEELIKIKALHDMNFTTKIKKIIENNEDIIYKIPKVIEDVKKKIILLDFFNGLTKFKIENNNYINDGELNVQDSKNLFLINPQPISYNLINIKGTILTGANSGGKTTLLEHILQISTLKLLGFPANGKIDLINYDNIYYFAKNKGSLDKGAFETLITQLSKIEYNNKTLILADEMESVTEPSIAAKIMATTIEFYTSKNCNLIFASHLGKEIKQNISSENIIRIDGIEAKGLDENNNVIIDHNPKLGVFAKSTPELIIKKMANQIDNEFLNNLAIKIN